VLPRSAREWGRLRRIKKTRARISTNSRMILPPPARGYKKKWFSTFLPACLLPLLLPRLLLSQETQRALWVLQILNSQHTNRAIRSIRSCTSRAIPHSNYPRSTSRATRSPPLSRPSPPPSPCRLYVRSPLRRAATRPALARSLPT